MKTLDVANPEFDSEGMNPTAPPAGEPASLLSSVGRRTGTPASSPEPCRHFVGLFGHLCRLVYDLGVLLFVYLTALVVGILIDQSGEAARHYQLRGTLFPIENGQPQYPVLFPGR